MAPYERTRSNKTLKTTKTTTKTTTKQPKTTNFKNKKQHDSSTQRKKQEKVNNVLPSRCSTKCSKETSREENEVSEVIDVSNNNSACLTPKGQKFRIPEISTCPPAPKKQRVVSNCSLKRSPLSFFVPPDLEHFFLVSHPDVSV